MNQRSFTSSVIENIIKFGIVSQGNHSGTIVYSDAVNKLKVVVDKVTGAVITTLNYK